MTELSVLAELSL